MRSAMDIRLFELKLVSLRKVDILFAAPDRFQPGSLGFRFVDSVRLCSVADCPFVASGWCCRIQLLLFDTTESFARMCHHSPDKSCYQI